MLVRYTENDQRRSYPTSSSIQGGYSPTPERQTLSGSSYQDALISRQHNGDLSCCLGCTPAPRANHMGVQKLRGDDRKAFDSVQGGG